MDKKVIEVEAFPSGVIYVVRKEYFEMEEEAHGLTVQCAGKKSYIFLIFS